MSNARFATVSPNPHRRQADWPYDGYVLTPPMVSDGVQFVHAITVK
jgi:hypothetical protein